MQPGKIDPCDMKVYMDMKVYIREVRGPDPRPDPPQKVIPEPRFLKVNLFRGFFGDRGFKYTK